MRKKDIERLLSLALLNTEIDETKTEYEKIKNSNNALEYDVKKMKRLHEDEVGCIPSVENDDAHRNRNNENLKSSSPETNNNNNRIPSLPPLQNRGVICTGRRHYGRNAHSSSQAPWERPPSRGALKETARRTARSKYIQNTNMLYYKSGEELGLEIAGDEGKPTLNYDGKILFPLNPRHPRGKPPNPRDASKLPPYASNLKNDKYRFVELGSVKPLFSSPYMKALAPSNNNNDSASNKDKNAPPADYIDDFLKYKKQDDQVEVKKRQDALKQVVYDPMEHQLPRPPLKPGLNRLGRAKKRRGEALMKKYGYHASPSKGGKYLHNDPILPKPPKRKGRYKTYKRAGRYDIYKETDMGAHRRVRGIRQRRTGRKTIFTEEEEIVEKERSPRTRHGINSDNSCVASADGEHSDDKFDDNASRISDISAYMQHALRTISKTKRGRQHDSVVSRGIPSYPPSNASSRRSFRNDGGHRRRRKKSAF